MNNTNNYQFQISNVQLDIGIYPEETSFAYLSLVVFEIPDCQERIC